MANPRTPPLEPKKTREAKLAEALRANLRRRKAADRGQPPKPGGDEPSAD